MLNRLLHHPVRIVLATIVLIFVLYEIAVSLFAYSGDAYVTSDVVVLSSEVSGPIASLAVADNAVVVAGDPLFSIDPTPYSLRERQAEAALTQARAGLSVAKDEVIKAQAALASAQAVQREAETALGRVKDLTQQGISTDASLDAALRDAATASANVEMAEASLTAANNRIIAATASIATGQAVLDNARYDRSKTVVTAPAAGRVAPFRKRRGDYLQVGSEVMAIITDTNRRIVAEVAERHLSRLRPRQRAWVTLGSDPWAIHSARVVSVGAGVARQQDAAGVIPYVAPTTDWVRIPQRFPVELSLDDWPADLPFHLGADARVLIWF
jgi:multidrug efflux system membrane fusion protein